MTASETLVAPHITVSRRSGAELAGGHWPMGNDTDLTVTRFHRVAAANTRARPATPDTRRITLAVLTPGTWTLDIDGTPVTARPDGPTLVAVDQFQPFDFRAPGRGSAVAVHTCQSRLALSIETLTRALARLGPDLPLHPLARDHLLDLGALTATTPQLIPELNATTVNLIRALLLSAADAHPRQHGSPLLAAVRAYIADHLDDPGLGAERIAAAHHLSVRALYKAWPAADGPLSAYIVTERLRRAERTLVANPHLSVAAVARHHGFASATHFTRRFRQTYGITPHQWRRRAVR